MEYSFLNLIFLGFVGAGFTFWPVTARWQRWLFTLVILLALTAIFDSFIIMSDIVAYDPFKLLGVTIWHAPIEDFAYAIAAAFLVPLLWAKLDLLDKKETSL